MRRKNVQVEIKTKTYKLKPEIRQPRKQSHNGAFFFGLIIGAVAGALAALFLTPKSGPQIRHQVKDQAGSVQQLFSDLNAGVRDRTEGFVGGTVDKLTNLTKRGGTDEDEVVVVAETIQPATETATVETPVVAVDEVDEKPTTDQG